jgi:hypothetical protein
MQTYHLPVHQPGIQVLFLVQFKVVLDSTAETFTSGMMSEYASLIQKLVGSQIPTVLWEHLTQVGRLDSW